MSNRPAACWRIDEVVADCGLLLAGCATVPPSSQALTITEPEIRATIATLSSDTFEGRMAGTAGEAKTIAYIADRFRAAGLISGARGPTPYLDPFAVLAKPAKPNTNTPVIQQLFVATWRGWAISPAIM